MAQCVNLYKLGKKCGKCYICRQLCKDENLTFWISQELMKHYSIQNIVNKLKDFDKRIQEKQDHAQQLDYLSSLDKDELYNTKQSILNWEF